MIFDFYRFTQTKMFLSHLMMILAPVYSYFKEFLNDDNGGNIILILLFLSVLSSVFYHFTNEKHLYLEVGFQSFSILNMNLYMYHLGIAISYILSTWIILSLLSAYLILMPQDKYQTYHWFAHIIGGAYTITCIYLIESHKIDSLNFNGLN